MNYHTVTRRQLLKASIATVFLPSIATAAQVGKLDIQVFNPGADSIFPVTSTLVTGPTEALLIDAQFQRNDALSVLKMIQDSGKNLTTIYISHGDPDFYFGLDVIVDAYPQAKIYASSETVAHIKKTVDRKIEYWGPILAENAPERTIVPDTLQSDTLRVDGQDLKIIGLNGHDPKHTFVWIPSAKTVAGGVVVYEGVHVWMADAQSGESREKWRETLDQIVALEPVRIVPGHIIGASNENLDAVEFTRNYVLTFEKEAATASDAAALIETMKARYPEFTNIGDLELSAKVVKGEMQWP